MFYRSDKIAAAMLMASDLKPGQVGPTPPTAKVGARADIKAEVNGKTEWIEVNVKALAYCSTTTTYKYCVMRDVKSGKDSYFVVNEADLRVPKAQTGQIINRKIALATTLNLHVTKIEFSGGEYNYYFKLGKASFDYLSHSEMASIAKGD